MISSIGPERAPNGDFGGRSFQGVGGAPTALRGAPVPFPGAPNTPGAEIGQPAVLRDTAGRRSNATVQYARVVPMASKAQKLETEALRPGVLAWTAAVDKPPRGGRGVERTYRLASWDWLQSEERLGAPGGGAGGPPRRPNDNAPRQRHAIRDDGTREIGLQLTASAADFFGLSDNSFRASPYLMWGGWNDGRPLREVEEMDAEYDALHRVRILWNAIYETNADGENEEPAIQKLMEENDIVADTPRLLSREVMGAYTPDGFVLYKYSTEGADSVAEGMLDDAQNGLFNVVVSGHAMVTSWAVFDSMHSSFGDAAPAAKKVKRLVTLPRDTLFIVVKGRWQPNNEGEEGGEGGGWFVDLRYVRSTSEELMRNSSPTKRLGPDTNVDLKDNEVVLGAWRIGSVIDSAASRTRPSTFGGAPTTPAQAMGLTVSVGIRWITSYALHDMFYSEEVIPEPRKEVVATYRNAVAASKKSKNVSEEKKEEEEEGEGEDGSSISAVAPGIANRASTNVRGTTGFRGTFRFGE